MTLKYVGVRHQRNQTVTYWFESPEELAPRIYIGCEVLCDTSRGHNLGTVVSIIDGVTEHEAKAIIGNFFPLKKIIGVSIDVELNEIHIPWEMETSTPSPESIANQISAFYDCAKFSVPVIFTPDLNLYDGYTAYLVAKMFEHERLHGFCTAV